jgi:hypothetical protein
MAAIGIDAGGSTLDAVPAQPSCDDPAADGRQTRPTNLRVGCCVCRDPHSPLLFCSCPRALILKDFFGAVGLARLSQWSLRLIQLRGTRT